MRLINISLIGLLEQNYRTCALYVYGGTTPINLCLTEVRAMVVAVQLPSAECTTIFTICIV